MQVNRYAETYSSPSQPEGQVQLAERRELLESVKTLEKARVAGDGNELRLALDRETKRPVVRIVNRETGELIQQFPTEEVIRLAQSLKAQRR
ncbi:MAG: flagellar protein FlaG [Bryobacteraceae bacterium]|nr:flagellar protein FlaG [Bryobacteraceae bacterium]